MASELEWPLRQVELYLVCIEEKKGRKDLSAVVKLGAFKLFPKQFYSTQKNLRIFFDHKKLDKESLRISISKKKDFKLWLYQEIL